MPQVTIRNRLPAAMFFILVCCNFDSLDRYAGDVSVLGRRCIWGRRGEAHAQLKVDGVVGDESIPTTVFPFQVDVLTVKAL